MFRRCVFGALALWIAAPAAFAAPSDYCKAYAIDFADQTKRNTPFWDQRFADAEKACLIQYSYEGSKNDEKPLQVQAVNSEPIPKPAVKKQPKAVKSVAEEVEVAAAAVQPKPARKKPKLEEGSVAWLDYCDKKYASFDRKTRTYKSRTGIERKCLVTSN